MTFLVGALIRSRQLYNVEVLPAPTGPAASTAPYGCAISRSRVSACSAVRPRWVKSATSVSTSWMRMTSFSPKLVGKVANRRSRDRLWCVIVIRPSCACRRSTMLRFDRIFRRLITGVAMAGSTNRMSWSWPSIRYRTRRPFSWGSKWMSVAWQSQARIRMSLTSSERVELTDFSWSSLRTSRCCWLRSGESGPAATGATAVPAVALPLSPARAVSRSNASWLRTSGEIRFSSRIACRRSRLCSWL